MRALVALIVALLLLPVLYALAVLGARRLPQPAEELAAISQMRAPTPPVAGRDASDLIWLMEYQVPRADEHRLAQALRKFYDRPGLGASPETAPGNPLLAYPKYPATPASGDGVCDLTAMDACLAYVRANSDKVAVTLQAHRDGLANGLRVAEMDGFRFGFRSRADTPIPQLWPQRRLVVTYFARRFALGEQAAAVDGLCRDMGGWRRLGGDSDHVIIGMVGASYALADLKLLAGMLSELPAQTPLSPVCQAALAPATDSELDVCPELRTEFPVIADAIGNVRANSPEWVDRYDSGPVDLNRMIGRTALRMARLCGPEAIKNARQDQSARKLLTDTPLECDTFERAVNPLGCQFSVMYASDLTLERYADRHIDLAAMIALMRTVRWLRQQPGGTDAWPRLLDARPASLGLQRKPAIAADSRSLSIPLLQEWTDKHRQSLPIGPAAVH